MKRLFTILVVSVLSLWLVLQADAAVVRIGNGDEGSDLEGFSEVTSGAILKSRTEAVKLLKSLHVNGVKGLGALLPEVESTKLYVTKKDSLELDKVDQGSYHVDMKGRVYARTFAEPHAPTRFFPVSNHLDQEQLVALHIHEGLHRALPPEIRENESIVSDVTLAITSPDSSFDRVQSVVGKYVPQEAEGKTAPAKKEIPASSRVKNPSQFMYGYRNYFTPKNDTTFLVNSMHVIGTELYPFGEENLVSGVGFELGLVNRPAKSMMGPLKINIASKMWSIREFDVGLWSTISLNTLSSEELKLSQYGRDNVHLGISIRKDLARFSVENIIGYTFASSSSQKIGLVEYTYEYGGVAEVSTHPAVNFSSFHLGGFAELLLGSYRVKGGAFDYNPGRYRILSAGPELEYQLDSVSFGLAGRFLLNATSDASYDSLGDLMGAGVAQGNVTAKVTYRF